jgi:RNA polymerase sigma-70 factor (ECF subfamily)
MGDNEMTAFAQEIADRMPKLKRYARALTKNEADAEDLVQDCVERALTRCAQFQTGTNLDAWLMTIMRSIFINGKRHDKLVREHARRERLAPQEAVKPNQMDHVELKEVARACARLGRNHRLAIRLLCVEQRSHKEAARVMGVPVATAKTRLFRARERLRLELEANAA